MNMDYLMVIELAMITIALGFLLQSQSNTVVANIVSAIVILVGVICLALTLSNWSNRNVPPPREISRNGMEHRVIQIVQIPAESGIDLKL